MDLIYMNADKEDLGVMLDCTLDLAYGDDENDFECKVADSNHCCEENFYLYIEGTEYGGIIDDIGIDSANEEVIYYGRTWHGILNSKIIEPDTGNDYLVLSGEANAVLAEVIERIGLTDLFSASEVDSGITISSYQMNRYIHGYDGIRKMLKSCGAKLNITSKKGYVELSAQPLVDYSNDEQFDRDQIELTIRKRYNPLNHVICLGKGELSSREVIHVYADERGDISDTQIFTGIAEVSDTYENANAESSSELRQGGVDMIKAAWNSDELKFDFNSDDECYDIGDIVGAYDQKTNTTVRTEITKKIVQIGKHTITISYPIGSVSSGTATSTGGSGSSGSGTQYDIGVGLTLTGNTLSVDSAQDFEGDNTRPVEAPFMHTMVGNIELLLQTI